MSQPDFRHFSPSLGHLPAGEQAEVKKAFEFAVEAHAGQKREDGSPYVSHVIDVAAILAKWKADRDTIIAALLHDVIEDTKLEKRDILEKFGRRVALLVDGITKFTQADLSPSLPLDRKVETLRKLFDVMRIDLRCVLIKLADRLHNVETIGILPGNRPKRIAEETLSVYYKIATHLGMRSLRHVFSEACVPHAFDTGPEDKAERDRLYEESKKLLPVFEPVLRGEGGQNASLALEPRNLLQFHMRRKEKGGKALVSDAALLSVIVKTEEECYQMLKVLHTTFRPVTGQFRDFIAAPSEAGYQSLHTVVMLPEGGTMEVRFRTPEMAEQASLGVILWLFGNSQTIPPTFSWLRRSKELDLRTRDSSGAFWEALEADILRETVSVLVDRVRISVPLGSTVLDVAYALYDSRAGFVKSATVAGRPEGLASMLKEDDDVHLVFDEKEQVGSDWLQLVSTQHARLLIVEVLKKMDRSEKVSLGRRLLQKELDHHGKGLISDFSRSQHQQIALHFRRAHFDDVLAMVGEGVIRARDMLFVLFPEKGSADHKTGRYSFRLHLNAMARSGEDILSLLHAVVRTTNVQIERTNVKSSGNAGVVDIMLVGSAADRIEYAYFVELLDRQEWISKFQTLISSPQKAFLVGSFLSAFILIALVIIFLPRYQAFFYGWPFVPQFVIQILPLIPILVTNYYLLQLLRHYVVRMRSESWFLGVGLLLNIVGLTLLITRLVLLPEDTGSMYPLIVIFVLSLFYMVYIFFQTEAIFSPFDNKRLRPIPSQVWTDLKSRKRMGYFIRLLAVTIWGIEPIYIRYTAVNSLSPFLRTFLLAIGVIIPSAIIYVLRSVAFQRTLPKFRIPYDTAFITLVIGQVGYMYFKNASLIYTTGTNLLLFNNFAPVIGLIIAGFLWRKDIPYLSQTRTMFSVFILAMLAGLGSSFLAYHTASQGTTSSVFGDALAMISTVFDVILVIGQIQYIKHFSRTDGMLLNIHIFFFVLLCMAPLILLSPILHLSLLRNLNTETLLLGLGIGLFTGFGQFLNYEAFKRIDGYLAFMMFNFSVLITFTIETFLLSSVHPTLLLMLSAALIMGSSIGAEIINSRCQKKGL